MRLAGPLRILSPVLPVLGRKVSRNICVGIGPRVRPEVWRARLYRSLLIGGFEVVGCMIRYSDAKVVFSLQ